MTRSRRHLPPTWLRSALVLSAVALLAVGCVEQQGEQPGMAASSATAPASGASAAMASAVDLQTLGTYHRYRDSVAWRLGPEGVEVQTGTPRGDGKKRAQIIDAVWRDYGPLILEASARHNVPAELLIAIIVEESSGRPVVLHREPGYVSDAKTPDKITLGLTGVLLGTARKVMNNPRVDRDWVFQPANAIEVAARYVAQQYSITGYDVPKVAAAYNAGAIYYNGSPKNHWKMLTHPKGSSEYIDNFVASFNMATAFLANGRAPAQSFAALRK